MHQQNMFPDQVHCKCWVGCEVVLGGGGGGGGGGGELGSGTRLREELP